MQPSIILRSLRLTLFTKSNCGLCVTAKESVEKFRKAQTDVQYNEIDIFAEGNSKWHDAYVFDVPVLHLEDSKSSKLLKLMHRFTKEEIESKSNEL